ncbi:dynamin family protein [Streptomyces sp. PSKA30]|nr:dynamin family protein [Streptomyces sp. PSKA30]
MNRPASAIARVCVVGDTNAGKSALINQLIGARCLPVSVHPTSSPVPTLVRASTVPVGTLDASAGRLRVVSAGPEASWLAGAGLELVEMPGWDGWPVPRSGTHSGDAEFRADAPLASALGGCDVIVVVTSAPRAMPASDRARLKALAGQTYCPPLLVVVTRLDEIETADEADEVMRRVRHDVARVAADAHVLAGPGRLGEESGERLESCRTVVKLLGTTHRRTGMRALRRAQLLLATCELIAGAAERALAAGAAPADPLGTRVAESWQAARTAALVNWIPLAAALDERRDELLGRVRAESDSLRALCWNELARELSQAPDAREFVRLRVVPEVRLALRNFERWITEQVEHALATDTEWLQEALAAHRPPVELLSGVPEQRDASPVPDLRPSVRMDKDSRTDGRGRKETAPQDRPATSAGSSMLPELVGAGLQALLGSLVPDPVAGLLGAVGKALVGDALERGEERRLQSTIDDLERAVAVGFAEHLTGVEERLNRLYARLEARARESDEQWWRVNGAAFTARPDSRGHWNSLLEESGALHRSVREVSAFWEEV